MGGFQGQAANLAGGQQLRRARAAWSGGRGDLHPGVHSGGGQLLGGLGAVAAVGEEHHLTRQQEQHPRRTGEAGEVADVGHAGDQEGVGADLAGRPARAADGRGGR